MFSPFSCLNVTAVPNFANFDNKFTVLPVDTPADGDLPAFLVGDDDDFPDWEFSRS